MRYKSTRGAEVLKTPQQAILQGIAADKGLFVPERLPELPFKPEEMVGKSYKDVALKVISAFFEDISEENLQYCVDGAYDDKFESIETVPVTEAGGAYFLELYHGKTAAFKDMALSILPYFFRVCMKESEEENKICILTATSGDTGKAALEGFADVPGTEIVVFYPKEGVSRVQERQMVTQTGENTHVFAIKGNFDDAQSSVKRIFNDKKFEEELLVRGVKLSSANSINIGRLVPQVAYYVYGYLKLIEKGKISLGEKINIVVPTGNFGNILAAYYAKKMGIPIDKLICASNENKILTDFLNSGIYDTDRQFHLTNSPSMDILISSNLERLLYLLAGEDSNEVKRLMSELEDKGRYEINEDMRAKMGDFYGGFATVEQTNETIRDMYINNSYLVDTHTAVAYKVYRDYVSETGDEKPTLIASTASPYKFAESVAASIGCGSCNNGFEYIKSVNEKTKVPIPKGLKDLDAKPVLHEGCIDIAHMNDAILEVLK